MSLCRYKFIFAFCVCSVAVAGTTQSVYASESMSDLIDSVGSESSTVGEFGSSDDWVNGAYDDLVDSVDDVGLDFVENEGNSDGDNEDTLSDEEDSQFDNLDNAESDLLDSDYRLSSSDILSDNDEVDLYASYNSYYGSISTSYVEYMRGYLPKLKPKEHYVAARVGQYEYIFAYGENLSFDSTFFGDGIMVIHWTTYDHGNFYFTYEDNFSLVPGSCLVYSDLSSVYPTLATSSDVSLRQGLILAVIVALVCTMNSMYQVRKVRKSKVM